MSSFSITAIWDEDTQVYYSESDIVGLHIEAQTIEEFVAEAKMHAPDMILRNHLTFDDLSAKPLTDLIPSIFLDMPDTARASRA